MKVLMIAVYPAVGAVLRQVLDGVAEALLESAEGGTALELCVAQQPDVVLLDLSLPGWEVPKLTRQLLTAVPTTRVLWLADVDDPALRRAATAAGAAGYVLKENLLDVRAWLQSVAPDSNPATEMTI